jgi:glyoxylase-like metal-dependent hydrolase (beta-lactamase superfamily II)
MQRDRISDDIYLFTSERYAQVTAGAVVTQQGAVLIDTLPFPAETLEIRNFVERRLNIPVRYVINSHYHADHTHGNYLFPNAFVIAHSLCRHLLEKRGQAALAQAKAQVPEFAQIELRLPDLVFEDGHMTLNLRNKTLQLLHSPGHSRDGVTVLVKEDRILFAADTVMPVPYIVDGDLQDMINSLRAIRKMSLENIIQGHGEVILRGEIHETLDGDIRYLENIRTKVEKAIAKKVGRDGLRSITIEHCGKSRIPLHGLVQDLHHANLLALYDRMAGEHAA